MSDWGNAVTIGLGRNGGGVLRMVRPGVLAMWCPGCMREHQLDVHGLSKDGRVNGFDGDMDRPSIGEPIRFESDGLVCEFLLRAGRLYFFNNCLHGLAGQEVRLPHFPLG